MSQRVKQVAEQARATAREVFAEQLRRPDGAPMVLLHRADPSRSNEDNIAEALTAFHAFASEYDHLITESN